MGRKRSDREMVRRELRRLARGRVNDCVKLALYKDVDIESLDLSLLTEIRRSERGVVEVKLLDRTKVLEQLARMADDGDEGAEEFLQALIAGMQNTQSDG